MSEPREFKPVSAAGIVSIIVVVMLVSWAIIGGAMAYAVKSNLFDKISGAAAGVGNSIKNSTSSNNSSTSDPSTSDSSSGDTTPDDDAATDDHSYEANIKTITVSDDTFHVGAYDIKLDSAAAQDWRMGDRRGGDGFFNDNGRDILCSVGSLYPKSGVDARVFNFGTTISIDGFKSTDDLGVGTEISLDGAVRAYVYNTKPVTEGHTDDHCILAELEDGTVIWFYQASDTNFYIDQADLDASTSNKYNILLSTADELIRSLKITG